MPLTISLVCDLLRDRCGKVSTAKKGHRDCSLEENTDSHCCRESGKIKIRYRLLLDRSLQTTNIPTHLSHIPKPIQDFRFQKERLEHPPRPYRTGISNELRLSVDCFGIIVNHGDRGAAYLFFAG